jgi:hypothetical protein
MSNRAENYELYLAVDGGADEEEMDMKERLPLEPVISATGATLPNFRASLV